MPLVIPAEQVRAIRELQASGKHAQALSLLRKFADSVEPDIWKLRGECASELGIATEDRTLLEEGISAWKRALVLVSPDSTPDRWADVQRGLGIALAALGGIGNDAAHLEDAVAAFRAELTVRSPERAPRAWIDTKVRLGDAMFELGLRGSEKFTGEAFNEYWSALDVCTPELDLRLWVKASDGIAKVWLRNEDLDPGGGQAMPMGSFTLLQRAERVYRLLVAKIPRATEPEYWATSQMKLGRVLDRIALRATDKAQSVPVLKDAISAYRASLEVFDREGHPVQWKLAQESLALAYENLGDASRPPADPASVYREAIGAYRIEIERFRRYSDQGPAKVALMYQIRARDSLRKAIEVFPAASEGLSRQDPARWTATRDKLVAEFRDLGGVEQAPLDPVPAYQAALRGYRELRKDADAHRIETVLAELGRMK